MRRDFDLIRKILIEVANQPAGGSYFSLTFPGEYPDPTVFEHVELLIEARLLEGQVLRSLDLGVSDVAIRGLTWAGHDFIEAIESDTNWAKVKQFLGEAGKQIGIETIKFAVKNLFGVGGS